MKILHVSQGLPPFRVGGMTRYCVDLMEQQVKDGDEVSLLYPGSFRFGHTRIIKKLENEIKVYSIINPLPLALVFGINSPERYMKRCDSDCYKQFLLREKFDVIHVHCIMGIHKEFFHEAGNLGIHMIYTTHDYYPFCVRCTLTDRNCNVCSGPDGLKCAKCNLGLGLSRLQEILMQSDLYRKLKYSTLLTKLRRKSRSKLDNDSSIGAENLSIDKIAKKRESYSTLLSYYADIMKVFRVIHCNSYVAEEMYYKMYPSSNLQVITITHNELKHCKHNGRKDKTLKIGFLGGKNPVKGLNILLEALKICDNSGFTDWELLLYGSDYPEKIFSDYRVFKCGTFNSKTEVNAYSSFDLLVMPSICKETFGFLVLEAIFHEVPIIVSDLVGAAMLLSDHGILTDKMVCPSSDSKELADRLKWFSGIENYEKARVLLSGIKSAKNMKQHAAEIKKFY